MIFDQEIKICNQREATILHHEDDYDNDSCFQESVESFKLGDLGKSEEIGKWGKCQNLTKSREISKNSCQLQTGIKKRIFFPNSICSDDFDNVNRIHDIQNQEFSKLCRKLMTWLV